MPYFSIETSKPVETSQMKDMAKKASGFLAELLGKPEAYVMVSIKHIPAMSFAGSDLATAFVRLKSIGLSADQCPDLSEKICGFIHQELGIPIDRIFIDFKNLDGKMFGWNGKTF